MSRSPSLPASHEESCTSNDTDNFSSAITLKNRLKKPALAGICLMVLALTACGGGGGSASGGFDGGSGSIPSGSTGGSTGGTTGGTEEETVLRIGTGTGENFTAGVISTSQSTVGAGETATLRVNIVDQNGNPPTDSVQVSFSSACVSNGLATWGQQTQVALGLYSTSFNNIGCDGSDTITATIFQTGLTATVGLTVVGPEVLTVAFVDSTFDQLSLAGIGGNESSELTFRVAGPQGVPVIGKEVNFSINTNVGGASILSGRDSGITDQDGLVRTILNSGTVAGPVNVLATHSESGRQGLSSDIIISTGVPEAGRFSMSYTPFNPLGAFNVDGVEVSISIIASDTFGNNPTDGTRVSFVSPEAGNVVNSCELQNGSCSVVWRSTATRPSDLRVEVIAYTDGAENFVDTNGNSVFDTADGSIGDLGEPYADENENGSYDLGEFFFDTDRDGVRDSGNGLWDGPCLDKVDPSAVCNGLDTISIYDSVTIVMPTDVPRLVSLGTFPSPGSTISITQGTSLSFFGIVVADNNTNAVSLGGNPLPVGTAISFTIEGAGITLQGVTSDTVQGNVTSPTGPYGTTLVAAEVVPPATPATNVRLALNVQVPGRTNQQFVWPITILP